MMQNSKARSCVAWSLALVFLVSCASSPDISQPERPFKVPNWFTIWEGTQPDYPLTNAEGDVIVIRGKEAKVGGSQFSFDIQPDGKVEMIQSQEDGRVSTFAGIWKGQNHSVSGELQGIVCDLSAVSTGAYRQYAILADTVDRVVRCYGTSKEPVFELVSKDAADF